MHRSAQKAIDIVLAFEKENNRIPKPQLNNNGIDIISSGRNIEVKGVDAMLNSFVLFSSHNYSVMKTVKNFYMYIVVITKDKNELYILSKKQIEKMIEPEALKIFEKYNKNKIVQLTLNYSFRIKALRANFNYITR